MMGDWHFNRIPLVIDINSFISILRRYTKITSDTLVIEKRILTDYMVILV